MSDWGVWRNVTCSPECSYKARLERRKELRKLQCETCEEIFQAHPERCLECGEPLGHFLKPMRSDARYCSAKLQTSGLSEAPLRVTGLLAAHAGQGQGSGPFIRPGCTLVRYSQAP